MTISNLTTDNSFTVSVNTLRRAVNSSPRLITAAALLFLFLSAVIVAPVKANGTYHNFSTGSLALNITPATADMISANDNWSGVPSVEGYCGTNLTATHGINPQTVLTSEFATLPSAGNTCVTANKGNPSAFNAGGIAEFDRNSHLAIGFQGNVQANPYMVFYLNTTGQTYLRVSYDVSDIDEGSNDSVSPIALQYRIGGTGNFTNLPAGSISDVTTGPNLAVNKYSVSVVMPAATLNQAQLQVRLITTNAAGADGKSTPDEWIGVNNVFITNLAPTAANAAVSGHVFNPSGNPLANATVMMYDSMGDYSMTISDATGFFRFSEVLVGETYVFEIRSRKYNFTQPVQVLPITEDHDSLNFFATPKTRVGVKTVRFF